jgi:hypothetical protein
MLNASLMRRLRKLVDHLETHAQLHVALLSFAAPPAGWMKWLPVNKVSVAVAEGRGLFDREQSELSRSTTVPHIKPGASTGLASHRRPP